MFTVSANTHAVLDILTKELTPGYGRCVDNARGAFMPLYVECTGESLFSVAHYARTSGGPAPDPEVEWWKAPSGAWLPVFIMQVTGHTTRAADVENGCVVRYRSDVLRSLIEFCDMWIGENFVEQQGGLDEIRAAVDRQPVGAADA